MENMELMCPAQEASSANGDLVIKLSKPHKFEGNVFEVLDLTALEDATAADMKRVAKLCSKFNPGTNPATLEMSLEYALTMAAVMTRNKLEMFDNLPAKDAMAVKGAVLGVLFAEDGTN